jgi:ferric-dicitrate binding protein FerR (iron transport regulator)
MSKKWHQLEKLDHKALKKLQAEREKAARLAQEAEEKKRRMIIGGSILFGIIVLLVFVQIMRSRAATLARQEERAKMLFSRVSDFVGKVEHRNIGTWDRLSDKIEFDKEYTYKTGEESTVTVQMQLDNQVKLFPFSEMTVYPPVLHEVENKIEKEPVLLSRGEMTVAISLDGRGVLEIEVADVLVVGASGLFKVIYDAEKSKGEVVVKNGLVEVSKKRGGGRPIKVSGFYKVTFGDGDISTPTQASVIQYDWR